MYQSVSPNVNFVEQEKKIEAFWEEEHIFEKAQTHDERMQAKKAEREGSHEKKSIMDKLAEKKKDAQAISGDKHAPEKAAEHSL